MKKDKMNFFGPGDLFIIVKKMIKENIKEVIEAYAKYYAYWLKLHYFVEDISMSMFNKLQAEQDEENNFYNS